MGVPGHGHGVACEACTYRHVCCLPQWNVLGLLSRHLSTLLAASLTEWVLNRKLLDNGQLSLLHLGVDFEQHALLGLFLMIHHGVALHRLVRRVDSAGLARFLSHRQLVVDLDGLTDIFQDVVEVQKEDEFALGVALLEELLGRQIYSVTKEITEDQAHALEELHVGHELQVLVNVASVSARGLVDVLAEAI